MSKVWSEMNEEERVAADQVYYDAMQTMTPDELVVWIEKRAVEAEKNNQLTEVAK